MSKTLFFDDKIKVKLEKRNNMNRGKFRRLAREVSGEVYDVPEDNEVIFVYNSKDNRPPIVGEISFSQADLKQNNPGTNFDTEYFPQISFLFVHRDFQERGLGRILMQECLEIIHAYNGSTYRPVRLQSAEAAVGFFERCGFNVVGKPYDCVGQCGSRLFRTLVNMEEKGSA